MFLLIGRTVATTPALRASAAYDLAQVRLRQSDLDQATALLTRAQAFWNQDPARWRTQLDQIETAIEKLFQQLGKPPKPKTVRTRVKKANALGDGDAEISSQAIKTTMKKTTANAILKFSAN